MTRGSPGNWHGPAVVIGTELDQGERKESYWLRYQGRCRLVPSENLRNATLEQSLSREMVVEEIRTSITAMTEERKPFSYDDDRKATPPGVKKTPETEEARQDPPDTPVFPRDPVSIGEATKKFFAGKTPSPYSGD